MTTEAHPPPPRGLVDSVLRMQAWRVLRYAIWAGTPRLLVRTRTGRSGPPSWRLVIGLTVAVPITSQVLATVASGDGQRGSGLWEDLR